MRGYTPWFVVGLLATFACGHDHKRDETHDDGGGGGGGGGGFGNTAGAAGEGGLGGAAGDSSGGTDLCRTDAECGLGEQCHPTLGCTVVCGDLGDVLIESSEDLLEFGEHGCGVLEGDLTIQSSDLVTLDALKPSSLKIVAGNLEIVDNAALESIGGLLGLEQVVGSLVVEGNEELTELSGVDSLKYVGLQADTDALVLSDNARLDNVRAFRGLELLLARVVVTDNPVLTSLDGLGGLRDATSVSVTNNAKLADWGAFESLETCSQTLTVANNQALESFALPSLFRSNSMAITSNEALSDVSLPSLALVSASLTVAGNPSLETLDLSSLDSAGTLTISGNPALPQCVVDAIDQRLGGCASCAGNDETASCE